MNDQSPRRAGSSAPSQRLSVHLILGRLLSTPGAILALA
jgi:hypothetical protein